MIPELPLPPVPDPYLIVVLATCVLALGASAFLSGWAERRFSIIGFLVTLVGIALFVWIWDADRAAFGIATVPEAFIEIIARIIR